MAFIVYRQTNTGVSGDVGAADGDYSNTSNWNGGAIPQAADDVEIASGLQSIYAGLDQSAVAIDVFRTAPGCTGPIGTESDYLEIDPNRIEWHGTGESFIDVGTLTAASCEAIIHNTATAVLPAVGLHLIGTSFSSVSVRKGTVGIADREDQTATVTVLNIGYADALASDAKVWVGTGGTCATINQTGGISVIKGPSTTINLNGGTMTLDSGTDALTAVNARGGTLNSYSHGTITTLTIWPGAVVDMTRSKIARTITNLINYGGTFIYDPSVVTLTNPPTSASNILTISG